jgi:RNA polymerase sigma-70 factor (ECF subfamily)
MRHQVAGTGAPSVPGTEGDDPGRDLMLRYQNGDESAFDRLVTEYSPRVYALLTRFLGPRASREDLVQEVFLRVVRARERYQPTARFSTWLYAIVFRMSVNETERRQTGFSLEAGAFEGGLADERLPAPEAALESQDRVRAVRQAIDELPPRQRMALVLSRYEGLSYEEVGRALGSTEKAIKSMVHRAREFLRRRLAPFLEEHAG